jgi:hypothetical protein
MLNKITMDVPRFIEHFCQRLRELIPHEFVNMSQTNFFKQTKENLVQNEFVIVMDFAENYSFVVQDEVQSFHWSNLQCTVHPFCVYFKNAENGLENFSFVVIAESLQHNIVAVTLFKNKIIQYIQDRFGIISKLCFFSDGAASQYKNKKNFYDICQLKDALNIDVEWHFFATSHGKNSCDAIGSTVKRMATRASLQRQYTHHILTAKDFYNFLCSADTQIIPCFCSEDEHEEVRQNVENIHNDVKTIKGTQSFHCFVPLTTNTILAKRTSFSVNSQTFKLKKC